MSPGHRAVWGNPQPWFDNARRLRELSAELEALSVHTAERAEGWERTGLEPGGGFGRPCPPLFPEPGGRHSQRAFRDMLADLLPLEHGWLPTIRISDRPDCHVGCSRPSRLAQYREKYPTEDLPH